jgi:hypothetical protein
VVYPASYFAKDGGLLSYGPAPVDNWRRAAPYVDRILRGGKPGDLPVQFPTKFEMVVNRKTAKALGLAIPPSILLRADEVIEKGKGAQFAALHDHPQAATRLYRTRTGTAGLQQWFQVRQGHWRLFCGSSPSVFAVGLSCTERTASS